MLVPFHNSRVTAVMAFTSCHVAAAAVTRSVGSGSEAPARCPKDVKTSAPLQDRFRYVQSPQSETQMVQRIAQVVQVVRVQGNPPPACPLRVLLLQNATHSLARQQALACRRWRLRLTEDSLNCNMN